MKNLSRKLLTQAALAFGIVLMCAPAIKAESTTIQLSLGGGEVLNSRQIFGASSQAAIRSSYATTFGRLDLQLSLAAEDNAKTFNADGSYVNLNLGDWLLGAGAVDRNWSYSPNTSLILSANARPMPTGYIRKNLSQSTSPLFSWIGPWGGELFLGDDNGKNFLGARLELEPLNGLKFELIQTAQFTGGLGAIGTALIGNTNEGSGASINKMAGFGISYERNSNRLYMQMIGEDEAGGLPSCWMHLVGFERSMDLDGKPTTLNLELVDTRIDRTENGFCGPNTAYNNSAHPYTNDGAVMGAPIDSESRSITLEVNHDLGEFDLNWGLGHYIINDQASNSHRLSTGRESGMSYHVGMSRPLGNLMVNGRITYQDFELDKSNIRQGLSVGVLSEINF
ncbi:capsule assembly Wzi family protein [Octadecabacter sp.]|nr:capsule assembly Wzi family protein [Octadecabacter sp.]